MITINANKNIYFLNITEKLDWMTVSASNIISALRSIIRVRIDVYIYHCLVIDKAETLIN